MVCVLKIREIQKMTELAMCVTTALLPVIRHSWMQTTMAQEMCVMIPITTVVEDAANSCVSKSVEIGAGTEAQRHKGEL